MLQFVVLAVCVAAANAGYLAGPAAVGYAAPAYAAPAYASAYHAPAAITSQSSNILRTPGNLGQVSTYTKTIDTPYSSVSKSDVRVSNPGYATYAAPAYAAPAVYARPAYAAAAVHAAPAVGVAYSAAPAVAHLTFDGLGAHYAW